MKTQALILGGALCALLATGCDQPAEKADTMPPGKEAVKDAPAADKKVADKKAAEPTKAAPAKDDKKVNYTIDAKSLDLTVGTAGELMIEVKPASGFKVNEEFPWKAKFDAVETVTMGSAEVAKDKWTLSKGSAAMKVPVTVTKAGENTLKATLNFSVCDEDACEVIRNKEVLIKVAAK